MQVNYTSVVVCRKILVLEVLQGQIFAARCSALTRHRICYGDVYGCVSVTLMYCAQTTESIVMRLSPDCSPVILVLSHQI